MASMNLLSENGGGDGYTLPERSEGVSSLLIKIACGQSGETSPPVASVTSSVKQSSLSCSILEQLANASTDWYPQETAGSSDDSGTGCHEGSDGDCGGGNAVKKPVWSKVSMVVSPVLGAVSWPALGESIKSAHKSSSSDSLQTLSGEPLLPELQVTGNSHKPETENSASTLNHVTNYGQRSISRNGGIWGEHTSSNGAVSQQSPNIQEPKIESSSEKPTTALNSYPKDNVYKESPRGSFGSQPNGGAYYYNYGGKLNQGRGRVNQQWNQHRNYYMETSMQSQRGGYIRPAVHNSTSYIHQPMLVPVQPFGNNVMYPGPFYYRVPEPLHVKIVKQIDYYFSNDNLVKDTYLRRHMDEEGWVPVNLIAGFNKVSSLTNNVKLILDAMKKSTVVEVQGEKMRRRNDWMRWLMPTTAVQDSVESQLQSIRLNNDGFSSHLQQLLGGGDQATTMP